MRKIYGVLLSAQNGLRAELVLPATPYAMLDALEKLKLEKDECPKWGTTLTYNGGNLFGYLDLDGHVLELNALCQQLALLDDRKLAIVEGLAKMEYEETQSRVPLPRLIDMAYSTDCCHIVCEATNDHTLGRFCAESGFVPEASDLTDEAFELLNFSKIGREYRQREGGVFTSGGYVQKHDELRQAYKFLRLTPEKPDYTILAETFSGREERFPYPANKPMGTEPVRCVDCAAPALIGISGGMERINLLARRLSTIRETGTLAKFKAIIEATGCDEIDWAISLADELEQYTLKPNLHHPQSVAEDHLAQRLAPQELDLLLPCLDLDQYGQALIDISGQLTDYGFVTRSPNAQDQADTFRQTQQAEEPPQGMTMGGMS